MKTARFKKALETCGAPRQYIPWVDPAKDQEFMKAVRENRVLTVRRRNVGTRKDSAEVGFQKGKERAFLVFPRSLQAFAGARIVGIDFDQVRDPWPTGDGVTLKAEKPVRKPTRDTISAVRKRFQVEIEVVARHQVKVDVESRTATDARTEAVKQVIERGVRFPEESLQVKARRARVVL